MSTVFVLVVITVLLFIVARIIKETTWKRLVDIATVLATVLAFIALLRTNAPAQTSAEELRGAEIQTSPPLTTTPTASESSLSVSAPNTEPPTEVIPTPTETLTPKPPINPGDTLYSADWSAGFDGWAGDESWVPLDGMLLNDGTKERATIKAPYKPEADGFDNYAIEVEIQAVKDFCGTFGIIGRTGYWGGISFTACYGNNSEAVISTDFPKFASAYNIATTNYYPGTEWHTYRLEMTGNEIRLLIDDRVMAEATDNQFLKGGEILLWSSLVQLSFRNFKVIAL